ncbi:hypothetical protein QFC20_005814 [Naganishia adeliensis]|uniref:Uncharacterized protein n=1 Tax=Naganishia adeliensis TaxID=92952 RepID=A0ACC2VK63_9TREE|nr:hypothetical protein QFC20_005814 [Naganishia adeliensis]
MRLTRLDTTARVALIATILFPVKAHQGCGGQGIARRNLGMDVAATGMHDLQRRYVGNGTQDVGAECSYYTYQPVVDAKSQFPTIWDIASLVPGDTEAQALFSQIDALVNSTVGDVRIKGTPNGDFSGFTPTYNVSDNDCWWTYRECTKSKRNIPADVIDIPEPRSYGMGFDDGPNCSHNAFYEFLRENKQTATMFYIGSNVMDWPLQAQDAITDGHQISIHTWSHNYMTALTNEQAFAELYYTRKAIKLVTGVTPLSWRPPFGDIDDRIRTIAAALNLTSILWQSDSDDWRINTGNPPVTSQQIDGNYQSLIDQLNNGTFDKRGTIMLTHELNNFTMSEAIKWYPQLKQAFAKIVPIASGYNLTHPYQENNVSYPDFGGNNMGASSANSASSSVSSDATSRATTGTASVGSARTTGGSATSSGTARAAQTAALKSGASAVVPATVGTLLVGLITLLTSR